MYRQHKSATYLKLICKICNRSFVRLEYQENYNRMQRKKGPFCGRRCAGYYGSLVQNKRTDSI